MGRDEHDDGRRDVGARWSDSAVHAASRVYEAAHGREISHDDRGMRFRIAPRVALTAVLAVVILATAFWWLTRSPEATLIAPSPVAAVSEQPTVTPGLIVHVTGEVASEGVVEVPAGARVADVVAAAGGLTGDADLAAVNLARPAVDGEHVHVPAPGESEPADAAISINRADSAQLQELPGIGPVLAERIVADRKANGPFSAVEDLARVSGIGPALLESLIGVVTL